MLESCCKNCASRHASTTHSILLYLYIYILLPGSFIADRCTACIYFMCHEHLNWFHCKWTLKALNLSLLSFWFCICGAHIHNQENKRASYLTALVLVTKTLLNCVASKALVLFCRSCIHSNSTLPLASCAAGCSRYSSLPKSKVIFNLF